MFSASENVGTTIEISGIGPSLHPAIVLGGRSAPEGIQLALSNRQWPNRRQWINPWLINW
jgi:hypothetical protein